MLMTPETGATFQWKMLRLSQAIKRTKNVCIQLYTYVYIYIYIYLVSISSHTHRDTHLLRNIFVNSDVECIVRAKTHWQETLDDQEWDTVRRKSFNVLAKRIKLFWCSAANCKLNRLAGSGLSRMPCTRNRTLQNGMEKAGTQIGVPICITKSNGRLRW